MSLKPTKTKSKGSDTIAAVRILVHGEVKTRILPARGDKPQRELHAQDAILIGCSRPLHFQKNTFELDQVLPEGVYMFSRDAIVMGRYDLEIDRYSDWVHLRAMSPDEKSKFDVQNVDLEDLIN